MALQNKLLTNVFNFIHKHRILVGSIFCIWSVGIIANHFINPHLAFISGEHIFSFDYFGHIKNILTEFYSNPQLLLQTNICENCPYIYHYSRWHALINFIVLSGGQLLKMNPFVYEIVFSLTVVTISTYLSIYFLNNQRVNPVAFLISNAVFSVILLNFIFLGSGRYPIQTSVLFLCIAYTIGYAKSVNRISNKNTFQVGVTSGVLGFIFLNTGVEFLPIYIYSVVIILLLPILRNTKLLVNQILTILISLGTTALLNFPITISLILNGNARRFDGFIPLTKTGSFFLALTSNLNTEMGNLVPNYIYIFLSGLILLLMIAFIKSRSVAVYCFCTYIVSAILMQGNFIYAFIFKHAPFMDSLRSVHRLTAFQHITIFIVIYCGLLALLGSRNSLLKRSAVIIAVILVFISFKYAFSNLTYPDSVRIPDEYFRLNEKLAKLPGKKVYFPPYLPPSQLLQGNYNWFTGTPKGILLYTNIFSSLFTTSGIQLTEHYEVGLKPMEIRSLLDLRNSYSDLQQSLMTQNIQYLVLDKNFAWDKNFPGFELDRFVKPFRLLSASGNLYLYEIKANPTTCPTAYGQFTNRYCYITHNEEMPQNLINISNDDFLLQHHKPTSNEKLESVNGAKYYEGIPTPALQDYLLLTGIPYLGFFTLDNEESGRSLIYRKHLEKGDYVLVINSIKMVLNQELPPTQNIEIVVNANSVARVSPYSSVPGIYSSKIPIHITNDGWVNVYIGAKGSSNMSEPYLIEKSEYKKLLRSQVSKIPEVSL